MYLRGGCRKIEGIWRGRDTTTKTQRNDTYTRAASGEEKGFWEAQRWHMKTFYVLLWELFIIFFFFSSDDHNLSHYLEE